MYPVSYVLNLLFDAWPVGLLSLAQAQPSCFNRFSEEPVGQWPWKVLQSWHV